MDINKTQDGDRIIFSLSGRLDTISAPKLQEALMPELDSAKQVLLDFAGIAYVSSAGLRVLLMGEKTAKAKGARQTFRNVSADVMEVFEMTGFSDILNIE
jgi:anti-anti-sigma factor